MAMGQQKNRQGDLSVKIIDQGANNIGGNVVFGDKPICPNPVFEPTP